MSLVHRHTRLIVFFGFGDGAWVDRILESLPPHLDPEILLVERESSVFETPMAARRKIELEKRGFQFWSGLSGDEFLQRAMSFFFSNSRSTYCSAIQVFSAPSLRPEEVDYYRCCERFCNEALRLSLKQFGNSTEDAFMGVRNFIESFPQLMQFSGITSAYQAAKDIPALCVATGPSLSQDYARLRKLQSSCLIIAADSAVKPLLDNGITPHFVTAIERVDVVTEMFRMLPRSFRSPLIALPYLLPETLEAYPGPIWMSFREDPSLDHLGVSRLSQLEVGPSCAHLSFRFAQHLGCSPLVLVGQDLAYSDRGESHVKGTGFESRDQERRKEELLSHPRKAYFEVEANDGSRVLTEEFLDLFRVWFEGALESAPQPVFNCSLKGAKIKGADYSALEELMPKLMRARLPKSLFQRSHHEPPCVSAPAVIQTIEAQKIYLGRLCSELKVELQKLHEKKKVLSEKEALSLRERHTNLVNDDQSFRLFLLPILNAYLSRAEIRFNELSLRNERDEDYRTELLSFYGDLFMEIRTWAGKLSECLHLLDTDQLSTLDEALHARRSS